MSWWLFFCHNTIVAYVDGNYYFIIMCHHHQITLCIFKEHNTCSLTLIIITKSIGVGQIKKEFFFFVNSRRKYPVWKRWNQTSIGHVLHLRPHSELCDEWQLAPSVCPVCLWFLKLSLKLETVSVQTAHQCEWHIQCSLKVKLRTL